MSTLAVRRAGSGPPLVLVHGGLGPELTWAAQEPLSERWELLIPWRRGFGASPAAEMVDFETDAADIAELLGGGAHLAGFSYGGLGAAVAATRHPGLVHSLTLIEAPLFGTARGVAEVEAMIDLSEEFISGEADEARREEFLELAGMADGASAGSTALAEVRNQVGRLRSPVEALPDLAAIAGEVPALIVSGAHHPAMESICDAIAEELSAERLSMPGAGHAAHRAAGFNERFEAFLSAAQARLPRR